MTGVSQLLSHPIVEALGWSLLHFLWQGLLLAAITAIVLQTLKNTSASLRYRVACIALAGMTAAPVITLCYLAATDGLSRNSTMMTTGTEQADDNTTGITGSVVVSGDLNALPDQTSGNPAGEFSKESTAAAVTGDAVSGNTRDWLTMLVASWLVGVTTLSLRLVLTLTRVANLRQRETSMPPKALMDRVNKVAQGLKVSRPVKLLQSALVEVPTVIGIIRPVILLPFSAVTGLSADQLDAILAHEIAHIRRHDYLVNLVQTVIETLLFYHPAVWWLSGRIRQERENCCDDIASGVCENPIRYAEALVRMEELRTPAGGLAMAATGGSLSLRIRRLLGQPAHESSNPNWWIGGLVSLLIVVALVLTIVSQSAETLAEENLNPAASPTKEKPLNDEKLAKENSVKLTPASIADSMQKSMQKFAVVDFSARYNTRNAKPSLFDSRGSSGRVRYRSLGEHFLAELFPESDRDPSWVKGFDGNVHFHTYRNLLILGEESLSGPVLSAINLFFSMNGRANETLDLLRAEDAKIVENDMVDLVDCIVVEINRERNKRSWTYRFSVAPERSWLPLKLERIENGAATITHRLSELTSSNGIWYPREVWTTRTDNIKTRDFHITALEVQAEFNDDAFVPPIQLGTNVLDRRVGYGWHEDPWWNDLKPWLKREYGWPRPDLFELHSLSHPFLKPLPLEGSPAPPIEPAEWLTTEPGGWDRPERKLTLLYFYGGRLISPTPKWAGAINELHRRYRKYGFEVVGLATATDSPELPRQAVKEMNLGFPVGIDQKSDKGYGKTFTSYGLQYYYHGLFFVDHEGIVQSVKQGEPSKITVDGKEFTISHMETKVIDLLKKAGVENVEPQVLPDDIFDIKTHSEVLAKWQSLRADAPKGASVYGRITFNGVPVPAATIELQPTMTIMSSNTGHGFMLFPDRAATITVPANPDGTYEFKNLTKGEYKFTCSANGMKHQGRTILIGADLPRVNVDVALNQK